MHSSLSKTATPHSMLRRHEQFCLATQVHVRRGDKEIEYPHSPDKAYEDGAAALQAANPGLDRHIFLSTEDETVIRYFVDNTTWEVEYANTARKPDPGKSTVAYARELGPPTEMLQSLVNLELALETSAWVGTLSSNWCRLIDEFRSTIGCRARSPFVDVAQVNATELDYYF